MNFRIVRLVCPMLPVSLDCPFLIAPSVFSNVYLEKMNLNGLSAIIITYVYGLVFYS